MKMVLDQAKPVPNVVPMRDDVIGDAARTLWMVAATALLVLLVTCANVANLLLVRADARHRELVGACRARCRTHPRARALSHGIGVAGAAHPRSLASVPPSSQRVFS